MLCDLVGSTEMSQKLDPEDLQEINRAYQNVCKAAIESYDAMWLATWVIGLLVYFGYPQAHEDDAERAVHAWSRASLKLCLISAAMCWMRTVSIGSADRNRNRAQSL